MDAPYRVVSFVKQDIEYTAQVWPIQPGTQYQARVILLANHGEDVSLFKRMIDALSAAGYESFFYHRMTSYQSLEEIRKEMNRVVKMCIDDIDNHTEMEIHKIHLLGQYIAASKALDYGIDGYFRHRLKSIIVVNPYLKTSGKHIFKSSSALIRSKISPASIMDGLIEVKPEQLTSDSYWLDVLEKYNFNDFCAQEITKTYSLSDKLLTKSNLRRFTVKNLLLIHSDENQFSSKKDVQFISKNISAESVALVEYEEGKNNLILETQDIFDKFLQDLITWLEQN